MFSAKIAALACFSLILVPMIVLAEDYPTKVGNQTVNIMIKPNNTVMVNNTEIKQLVQQLQQRDHTDWNYGDLIIGSSTIVAFFGIGSMVVLRFEIGSPVPILLGHLRLVFHCIFIIIATHLIMVVLIISKYFDPYYYVGALFFTILIVGTILYHMHIITRLNNMISTDRNIRETADIPKGK